MRNRFFAALLTLAIAGVALLGVGDSPVQAAGSYTPITGEGSSWAANAIDDWRSRNASTFRVNFAATGSVAGLTGFAAGTDDFAASDIPYGVENTSPNPPGRGYAYLPDVAGGTALMYNLQVGGKRFTNLKLSGETVAGIFEGTIKTWNDPKIAADNPGVALPGIKITPVVRSDGSGSTAQFSLYLEKLYPSIWTCGEKSFFTQCPKYDPTVHQAKSGDNGVAGFVAQAGNQGSIGYVEYSYALQSGFPVAKVLNKAGVYVLPTASNVAVALLKAQINTTPGPNYLTQNLDAVYTDPDPRTYPISSYSYFVIPTELQNGFTTDKGRTLGAFAYYALCQGQQQAPTLGYSPLPINLVQAGLAQIAKIPGVETQNVDIKACNNPTFSANGTNTLAKNALYPDMCDKKGAAATCVYGTPVNGKVSASAAGQADQNKVGAKPAGTTAPAATGGGVVATVPDAAAPAAPEAAAGGSTSAGGQVTILNPDGKTSCDPDTGECTQLAASPVEVGNNQGTVFSKWAVWLMIAALLMLILAPAVWALSTRRSAR